MCALPGASDAIWNFRLWAAISCSHTMSSTQAIPGRMSRFAEISTAKSFGEARKIEPVIPFSRFALFSRPRRAPRSRRGGFALVAILLGGSAVNTSVLHAQQSKPAEYQVKAVYLYNFSKFVEWPATAEKENSFAICILGRDPFGPALD